MDLVEMLAGMTTDGGLSLALIVGRDGLLVEGQARNTSTDLESLGAMATRALIDMERLGRAVAAGNLSQIRLRFDSYQLLIEALTPSDVLVAGLQTSADAGRLLDVVASFRAPLQELLGGL
jgi:predicted regulator of Ras-like GTPase activity (Roadblock/LC7/MglB family)